MPVSCSSQSEATSTSYPYDKKDIAREVLSAGNHTLTPLDNVDISTTTWTYQCVYCKFKGVKIKSILNHEKVNHPGLTRAVSVAIE